MITDDGVNWVYVESNMSSDNSWRKFAFRVKDYVNLTNSFRIKFIASDSIRLGQYLDGGSLVEAAVDDVYLYEQSGPPPTSINNFEDVYDLEIYPNPSSGIFYIENFEKSLDVKVLNSLGDIILDKSIKLSDNIIDISGHAKGVYYLEIYQDNVMLIKKLVFD